MGIWKIVSGYSAKDKEQYSNDNDAQTNEMHHAGIFGLVQRLVLHHKRYISVWSGQTCSCESCEEAYGNRMRKIRNSHDQDSWV